MIIQSGKIVIKSLQKGLMKGTKKLKGLLDRILTKFKFKKFKLERKGKHIRLYARSILGYCSQTEQWRKSMNKN